MFSVLHVDHSKNLIWNDRRSDVNCTSCIGVKHAGLRDDQDNTSCSLYLRCGTSTGMHGSLSVELDMTSVLKGYTCVRAFFRLCYRPTVASSAAALHRGDRRLHRKINT